MSIAMSALRVYVKVPAVESQNSAKVFYSRRADGPYYRWRFEEEVQQWRGSRLLGSEATPKPLSVASWKLLPPALRVKLAEHYME